jgi:hypothetical protein
MKLLLRAGGLALLLTGSLAADVLVLKDGTKVGGKVVDKTERYEVTTDMGLRSYLKDEVEKVLTSPKELVGDSDKLFEEAKQEYTAALQITDQAQQTVKLKETLTKVKSVRESLSLARDLFPDDKFSDLDARMVQVIQLMRLLRERVSVDLASGRESRGGGGGGGSAMINPPVVKPPSPEALATAFSALVDPAKRVEPLVRTVARETFRSQRANFPQAYDIATAAMIFLSRPEAEWKISPPVAKTLQDYFAKPWLKDPVKLTPAMHQEAAAWLLDQVNAVRKTDPNAAVDALTLFGVGHYANAPFGPDSEKTARALGLTVKNGIAGTIEGYVVRELDSWISSGEFDIAVLTWKKEYRDIDTPAVRYVWAYALLRVAQLKKKGFDRPVSALETVTASDAPTRDHLLALEKSIKAEASCSSCGGEGKFRCPNCCGKKEIRTNCTECKGTGKKIQPGKGFRATEIPCYPCRGRGYTQRIVCEKCKDGHVTCAQCGGKTQKPPELEEICTLATCPDCDGRGWSFRTVIWACRSCMGLGLKITPKADPTKLLP